MIKRFEYLDKCLRDINKTVKRSSERILERFKAQLRSINEDYLIDYHTSNKEEALSKYLYEAESAFLETKKHLRMVSDDYLNLKKRMINEEKESL